MTVESTEWQEQAVCADVEVDMFAVHEPGILDAKAVCTMCPVSLECLTYGMEDEYGIFGGKTPAERAALKRKVPTRRSQFDSKALEAMRAEYATGEVTQRALAAKYGISRSHVANLLNGRFCGQKVQIGEAS